MVEEGKSTVRTKDRGSISIESLALSKVPFWWGCLAACSKGITRYDLFQQNKKPKWDLLYTGPSYISTTVLSGALTNIKVTLRIGVGNYCTCMDGTSHQ